jgi:hypothetical protein
MATPQRNNVIPWPSNAPTIAPSSPDQLDNIKAHLDLVLLALEALSSIGSEAMLQAAEELELGDLVADRVALWRLRQSSPLRKGQGRKKLDVDEARALVLVCCHLAQRYHADVRSAVTRLEQLTAQKRPPHEAAILGDYLDRFCNLYQDRMADDHQLSPDRLTEVAFKLLIDLLFYGTANGVRRLWVTLIDRSGLTPDAIP